MEQEIDTRAPREVSRTLHHVLVVLIGVIIVLCAYQVGVFVGYRKAMFSYRWGQNYHTNFAGPRQGFFRNMGMQEFTDAHGMFGMVLKVDGETIVLRDKDFTEKAVRVSPVTVIRRGRDMMRIQDLVPQDRVVIIGSPTEDGLVEARLIRVFQPEVPSAPMMPIPFNGSGMMPIPRF